jgi:hypothetical protein
MAKYLPSEVVNCLLVALDYAKSAEIRRKQVPNECLNELGLLSDQLWHLGKSFESHIPISRHQWTVHPSP